MHESGLTRGLVRATLEAAAREGGQVKGRGRQARRARRDLAEHLREHCEEALRGTMDEGAVLVVSQGEDPTDEHALDVLLEWVEVTPVGQD